jgi:hypothetical protein
MEVATIITSSKNTFFLFEKFICSYPTLVLIKKDDDTAYFQSTLHEKNKIFFHFKLNNPPKEFSYNYSNEDIVTIDRFYGKTEFLMFDLSYRPESLLTEVLSGFKAYLLKHNKELLDGILISHPFDGLKSLVAVEY